MICCFEVFTPLSCQLLGGELASSLAPDPSDFPFDLAKQSVKESGVRFFGCVRIGFGLIGILPTEKVPYGAVRWWVGALCCKFNEMSNDYVSEN